MKIRLNKHVYLLTRPTLEKVFAWRKREEDEEDEEEDVTNTNAYFISTFSSSLTFCYCQALCYLCLTIIVAMFHTVGMQII